VVAESYSQTAARVVFFFRFTVLAFARVVAYDSQVHQE
jgi:hypothetical protein